MARDPDCVFCRIIDGKISAHVVHSGPRILVMLDIGPLAPGHLLVVPKDHYKSMHETPDDVAAEIGAALPRLVAALLKLPQIAGVNVLQNNGRAAGQEVEHMHVHLIPRALDDGLGYRWRAGKYAGDEAESIRRRLVELLEGSSG